jgi:hypothetical protein
MYKGTRHTRASWSYKGTPGISRFELRMLADRCKETFVPLQLLRPEDFERPIGNGRISRSRELLVGLGIPQTVIAGVPLYVLAAPLFGGLMSRMSRRPVSELPAELHSLHAHLRTKTFEAPKRGPSASAKTLYHVAKDGTRTAFERKPTNQNALSPARSSSQPSARPTLNAQRAANPAPAGVALTGAPRVLVAPDTALSLAITKALGRKYDKSGK